MGVIAPSQDNNHENRSSNQDKFHDPSFASGVSERVGRLVSVNTLVHVVLLDIKSEEGTQTKPNVDNVLAEAGHSVNQIIVNVGGLTNKP